jgi:Kunitz/Bovine pancreatic trypsin inhibitor domain
MPHIASFARLGMFTTLALVLASACGGQSFTSGGDGEAGSGSNAGSGQGGGTSRAGSTGTAGKGHAGTGTGGGSAGGGSAGTGSAGTGAGGGSGGSTQSDECGALPDSGPCDAYSPSWYNDASTGICRPFVYGGCGGNANRYPSLAACQQACPGGNPNYDSCKLPSDCVVTGTGCCGICDSANISVHDLIAYNKQYASLLQCGLALDIAAGGSASAGVAAPIACAPCPAPLPGQGTRQYFVPDCVARQCVVDDLRTSPVTACKTSDECKLRHGTGCCEGCGSSDLISVRNDGSFEKLVCAGGAVACPACVPAPTDAVAVCGAQGRCEVAIQ